MSGNLASTFSLDVSNFIASMQQAGTVTQTQADKMQRTLNALNKQIGDLAKSTKQTAANADAYDTLAQGAERATRSHAGLNREILVLTHELSQGNWKRAAGSLMVFGEYASSIGAGALASAAGVAGLVAAVGVLGLKIAQGAMESDKFNKSLILTGNYAGMTADRLTEMARAAAASTNSTIGESRGVFAGLTASGAFGPGQISAAGQDVLLLERVTGQSSEEIVKDFAKMSEGVTRWAAEHNRSMHFITAGQYDYIRQLEEQGKTEQAEQIVLDALKDHLDGVNQNLGLMARAWLGAKQAASSFFAWVQSIGATKTLGDQLQDAQKRLEMLKGVAAGTKLPSFGEFLTPDTARKQIPDQERLIAKLREQQATAQRLATEQAESDARQQEGIKGSDVVKQITEEIDKRSMATRKVEEYTAAVQKMREAGDPNAPTAAQEAETVRRIYEKFQNRDARKFGDEVQSAIKSLTDEAVRLKAEADSYDKYGHAIDNARTAVMRFRLTQGDLKGATNAQGAALLGAAGAADAADAADRQAKAAAAIRDKVKALTEEASARAISAREEFIAQQAAGENVRALSMESEANRQLVDSLRAAAGARYDAQVATPAIEKMAAGWQAETDKINADTNALGQNALALQKAAERARILAQAQQEIAKNPEREAEIWQRTYDAIERRNQALDRASQTARSPAVGASQALQRWADDASNGAKQTENLITGLLNQASDAFVHFAQTGKLNLGSLFQYWEEQVLRIEANKAMLKLLGLLDITGAGNKGIGTMIFDWIDGSHANGLDYVPYNGYIAQLHEGERVLTKQENQSFSKASASGSVIHIGQGQVIQIGQGVSRAEVTAGINQALGYQEARFRRLMRQERLT